MTGLTQHAAAVEAAMGFTGAAAFGLSAGSILVPADLYRPLGLPASYHHRPTPSSTVTTPPTSMSSEFHQHRSPFAIQQLLGLGPDKKQTNDRQLSTHRADYQTLNISKTKEYRDYEEKVRSEITHLCNILVFNYRNIIS